MVKRACGILQTVRVEEPTAGRVEPLLLVSAMILRERERERERERREKSARFYKPSLHHSDLHTKF